MGTANRSALNVRFTYGGGAVYVYIGELGSSWSYPQVFITDVQVGFADTGYTNWDDNWSIGFNASTYNNISSTHTVYPPTQSGNNTGAIYAPTFYDSNSTSYYLDPASTSELNKVYYNSNMVARNYGLGQVGLYSSTIYQAVWSMGEAYILPANGSSTGTLYGIAWSYPSAGGAAANLASHGMLILEAGAFKGAWGGGSFRTPADVRGTIFYDYDNTSYFVDPTGTSNFGGDIIRGNITNGSIYLTGTLPGYGVNTYPTLRTDGSVLYFAAAGVYSGYWSTYDFVSRGNVTAYSDETLKTNWRDLPDNFVEKLSLVKHGIYDRIDTGLTQEGVSAQSLQPLLPNSVFEGVDGKLVVNYGSAALVSAVELAKYVTALEERIKQLEARF
jgi:hypothetical protein